MKQVIGAFVLACAGLALTAAVAAPAGEKWKITSQMQMGGMSMPGQSNEICKQPGDDSVPMKTEENCELYDVKRSGNTQSFKMRCTGKDAAQGAGEFTYLGPDHYKGKMQVAVDGESMTMAVEGQKIGACDGGEINLKAKEYEDMAKQQMALSAQAQKEQCRKLAAEATSPGIMKQYCTDPADRQTFCAAVQTHDKFLALSEMEKRGNGGEKPLTESASLCAFGIDAKRQELCKSAYAYGNIRFIGSQCPAEAEALAKAQCAGRRYTAIADQYRDFCASYAQAEAEREANSPAGKTKSMFNMGKKALGLFNN